MRLQIKGTTANLFQVHIMNMRFCDLRGLRALQERLIDIEGKLVLCQMGLVRNGRSIGAERSNIFWESESYGTLRHSKQSRASFIKVGFACAALACSGGEIWLPLTNKISDFIEALLHFQTCTSLHFEALALRRDEC